MTSRFIPKTVSEHLLFHHFFRIYEEILELENGQHYSYYTLKTVPFATMILSMTPEKKLVLNYEYRHPVRQYLLSCPGGLVEQNESPLEGALRELLEETGYKAENPRLLGESYPFPGISTQKIFYVFAENARKVKEPEKETGEILETCELNISQVREEIAKGTPIDGILTTGLFYLLN